MTDWTSARAAMLAAFEPSLGPELTVVFDKLLPSQRWREGVPAEHWQRSEVREAMLAHSRDRRHLHESLVELLGETHAGTLMEYLVPAPWIDLVRLGVPVADLKVAPSAA